MSTESLKGKKALVIGGSRGIGAAIVRDLAHEGAAVAFTYASSRAPAQALVASIEDAGGRATALHADSADATALDGAVDRAAEALGGLDILVNNAGILVHGNVADYSLSDFDKMIAVNVRGVFVAAKAAARHLPPGGKMIVIGSNTARRAFVPGAAVYGMTKAGGCPARAWSRPRLRGEEDRRHRRPAGSDGDGHGPEGRSASGVARERQSRKTYR
jgi:3-oxoacyl-[acyl-carrier protein] reductase